MIEEGVVQGYQGYFSARLFLIQIPLMLLEKIKRARDIIILSLYRCIYIIHHLKLFRAKHGGKTKVFDICSE
jgi:hypothetical protein